MSHYIGQLTGNKNIKSINPTVTVRGTSVSARSSGESVTPNNKIVTTDINKIALKSSDPKFLSGEKKKI